MTEQPPPGASAPRELAPSSTGHKPNLASSDPYEVLGLPRRALPREIKRAYFELVRQYPPETAADAFKLIRAAYEKLQTNAARSETDLFLFQPPPPWEPRKRPAKLELAFAPEDIWILLSTHGSLGATDFEADFRPVKI